MTRAGISAVGIRYKDKVVWIWTRGDDWARAYSFTTGWNGPAQCENGMCTSWICKGPFMATSRGESSSYIISPPKIPPPAVADWFREWKTRSLPASQQSRRALESIHPISLKRSPSPPTYPLMVTHSRARFTLPFLFHRPLSRLSVSGIMRSYSGCALLAASASPRFL